MTEPRETAKSIADWSKLPRAMYVVDAWSINNGTAWEATMCSVPMAMAPEVRYSLSSPGVDLDATEVSKALTEYGNAFIAVARYREDRERIPAEVNARLRDASNLLLKHFERARLPQRVSRATLGTLHEIIVCFASWQKDVRVLGNVRSEDAVEALTCAIANLQAAPLLPVDRDHAFNRDYIPIPGGWEIQTKGKGSTFRIANMKTGEQIPVIEDRLHAELTQMALDAREAYSAAIARAEAAEAQVEALRAERDANASQAEEWKNIALGFRGERDASKARSVALNSPDSRERLEEEISLHVQLAVANGPKITIGNIVETCLGFALSQRTVPVPAGFVLLPEVPTVEMSVAFAEQWFKKRRAIDDADDLAECWPHVIAAAPAVPDAISNAHRNAIIEEIASGYEGGDLHRADDIAREIRMLKSGAGKG